MYRANRVTYIKITFSDVTYLSVIILPWFQHSYSNNVSPVRVPTRPSPPMCYQRSAARCQRTPAEHDLLGRQVYRTISARCHKKWLGEHKLASPKSNKQNLQKPQKKHYEHAKITGVPPNQPNYIDHLIETHGDLGIPPTDFNLWHQQIAPRSNSAPRLVQSLASGRSPPPRLIHHFPSWYIWYGYNMIEL